jgi:hypothetical protein
MSFQRHGQIYQSDVLFRPRSKAVSGFAPGLIVSMSLRPAIPRQVGLHQSPPPLHRLKVILNPSAETVNHHPAGAGEFSTGEMRNFQPALTFERIGTLIESNRLGGCEPSGAARRGSALLTGVLRCRRCGRMP